MAEAIHFQRVTIHLKNGTNLVLDLKPEDHQTVDSQITALQDVLADPESQEKVFQFRGNSRRQLDSHQRNRRF